MQEFNGLLIVASALSVFCQYVDNTHRYEIEAIKRDLKGLVFPDGDGDDNVAIIKKQWDDFLGKDCLRAKPFIVSLFCYLIAIVGLISVNFALSLYKPGPYLKPDEYAGLLAGAILFCIALGVGFRLMNMSTEVKHSKQDAKQLLETFNAIKSVMNRAHIQQPPSE